jgi:Dolichyl-phosphate-mannose-protein mannosyltransferase
VTQRPLLGLALLFPFLLATRLCHTGLVWVEEAYPATAAIQMLNGKTIYRDFWFDKPPLTPLLYLLWGSRTGLPLRIAGAVFLFAGCWIAWKLARSLWTESEGIVAAALLAFFVTFDVPSAVMALAPDLVMLLPHLAAVYLAARRRPFAAGLVAGAAMLVNPKGVFVLAACVLWSWREWLPLAAGFAAANGAGLIALAAAGALPGYFEQVWAWGSVYSRDTFIDQPLAEGLRRTSAWLGFHAAIVLPAAWYWLRDRSTVSKRLALWTLLSLAGIVLGWRFFPRYYFLLLPAVTISAARGLAILPVRARWAMGLLLLIPLVRFGPRYAILASDLAKGRDTPWADVAMNQDSRRASRLLSDLERPQDTLLVWGYRPDIFLYTRLPAGSPFLDSQPLTGVIADRHLTKSEPSAPELAARNRLRLSGYRPTWIVDGLGPYNPRLAIVNYPDLAQWLAHYEVVGGTGGSVVYRLSR